jgi:HEAT repeat protein
LDGSPSIGGLAEGAPAAADLRARNEKTLPELLGALASGQDSVRDGAVLALVGMGPAAWPSLVQRLRDPSRRVRFGAARVLEETGWTPPDAREAFAFRTALGDWDAVAGMGDAAVPFLVEAVLDRDPGMREEAARALGRSGDGTAVRPLADLLARDPEEEVREASAAALGMLADPAAVPALRASLADRSHTVRLASATALDGLGWRPANEDETVALLVATAQWSALGSFGAAAAPLLTRALGDDYYGIRRGAGGALLALGAAARPALERARADPDPAIRDEAAALLARMGPAPVGAAEEPAAEPEEEPATGEERPTEAEPEVEAEPESEAEVQPETEPETEAEAVAELVPPAEPAPPTLDDLAGLLYAGESAERLTAAGALATMPPERAVPALAGTLIDPDPALREAAVASLGVLATPAAMPLLIDRLADTDGCVRGAAVRALASAGLAAVPFLVAALGRPEREVRTGAAGLIVRTGSPSLSDREELDLTLGLEDWRGLARFGADAVEPLAALLVQPDPDLRLGAVIALGEIEGDRATDLIRQAYADPSPAVRNRAALLLHLRRSKE